MIDVRLPKENLNITEYVTRYSISDNWESMYTSAELELSIGKADLIEQKTLIEKTSPFSWVVISLEDEIVCWGYVTEQEISNTGDISIAVVGYLHNLSVSCIGPYNIMDNESLIGAIRKIVSGYNIGTVNLQNTDDIKTVAKKAEETSSVAEYLQELIRDAGVMLKADNSKIDTLLICKPTYTASKNEIRNIYRHFSGSNVLDMRVTRDWEDVSTEIVGKCRTGKSFESSSVAKLEMQHILNPQIPASLAPEVGRISTKMDIPRKLIIKSEKAKTQGALDKRLLRTLCKTVERMLRVSITLDNHGDSIGIYKPDTLWKVVDTVGNVDELFWCKSVSHSGDLKSTRTRIDLIRNSCLF